MNPSSTELHFLNAYSGRQLDRLALPLGGIGAGTVSLNGRGKLQDWEIVNHTAKGFAPGRSFFAVAARSQKGICDCRLLEGEIPEMEYEGGSGCPVPLAGVRRFARAQAETVYPFIRVRLSDPSSPVTASILAYNPFIPGKLEESSWPVAVFEIELTNRTASRLDAAIVLGCDNFIGTDGIDTVACEKRNRLKSSEDLGAVWMSEKGLPKDSELRGDFCIAVDRSEGRFTSTAGFDRVRWNNDIRHLFEHFSTRGEVSSSPTGKSALGAVCLEKKIAAGKSATWKFYISWRFPNRLAWSNDRTEIRPVVGNYYASLGADSWRILKKFARELPGLRLGSVQFANSISTSDLPATIKEAALANLPALRSQTLFRTPDGRFFGYEGGHRNKLVGGTLGSCTHVWGYDLATSFLFPEIAHSFRTLQFGPSQHADGAIAFRTGLPLEKSLRYGKVAADGQLASIIGFYRDCKLSSDLRWKKSLWPRVRQAILFCWQEGSWDSDQDGVMEGCQHNTMDVDYYGPNPLLQGLYITALRCGAELAEQFGDKELEVTCRRLALAGSRYLEEKLFNGDYFIQKVPRSTAGLKIDPRLLCSPIDSHIAPDYQVGEGVLIDQMLGGLHACVCGIEEPVSPRLTLRTLNSVVRHNFRSHLGTELNHMRSFGLGNEPGVLMATWPRGGKPATPFPYYCEVMTGFEHALAAHLLYHGVTAKGLKIISAIRSRYTGNQRNPFNEAEWGNHYARALASWASLWAWTGQQYDADSAVLSFRQPQRRTVWPWFIGTTWGTIEIIPQAKRCWVKLKRHQGSARISQVRVGDATINQHEGAGEPVVA